MPEIFNGKFKIKREYLIVFVLLVAVIVITLSVFIGKKEDIGTTDTEKYVLSIEEKLENSILKIDGVKNVEVAVKVNGSITTVIATDKKTTEENGKTVISSSPILVSGKPIVLGEIYPEITGIVVVCNCKEVIKTKMMILDVVTTMLDVPCEKVRILTQ